MVNLIVGCIDNIGSIHKYVKSNHLQFPNLPGCNFWTNHRVSNCFWFKIFIETEIICLSFSLIINKAVAKTVQATPGPSIIYIHFYFIPILHYYQNKVLLYGTLYNNLKYNWCKRLFCIKYISSQEEGQKNITSWFCQYSL